MLFSRFLMLLLLSLLLLFLLSMFPMFCCSRRSCTTVTPALIFNTVLVTTLFYALLLLSTRCYRYCYRPRHYYFSIFIATGHCRPPQARVVLLLSSTLLPLYSPRSCGRVLVVIPSSLPLLPRFFLLVNTKDTHNLPNTIIPSKQLQTESPQELSRVNCD